MRFTVICTADPYDETGGIHIVWNIHTMDGCGPGAEEEDAAIDGTFDVAFGAVQVLGAGKPGHACFSDAVDPADDICTENGTLVNGIGFISQLRQ
jgi:hypothetical protein